MYILRPYQKKCFLRHMFRINFQLWHLSGGENEPFEQYAAPNICQIIIIAFASVIRFVFFPTSNPIDLNNINGECNVYQGFN